MNTILKNFIIKLGKTLLFSLSAILFLISCEKELKIKPDDFPPMLVLNGVVEQDSIFCINVSRTASLNETVMLTDLFVTDAIVCLYDGDDFLETMQHDSLGFYSSTCAARGGHKYSIKVEKGDYPIATAILDFSKTIDFEISDFRFEKTDSTYTYGFPEPGGEILLKRVYVYYTMRFFDNPDEKNYYSFSAITKTQEISYYGHEDDSEYDVWLSDLEYSEAGVGFEDWTESDKYDKVNFDGYNFGTNNYRLNAYSDKQFNGQNIAFSFMTYFKTSEVGTFSLSVKSYPEGIIKYFETYNLYYDVYDSPYVEPVNIYSNVQNGVGIVCGIPCSKIEFVLE